MKVLADIKMARNRDASVRHQMLRIALQLVFSLSCAGITAGLVVVAGELDEELRQSFVLATIYSMGIYGFATASFAAAGLALPTYRLLPERYYSSDQRVVGFVYRVLGVWLFRRILLVAYWSRKGNRKSFFNGKKSGIAVMTENQKRAEFGHLGSMVVLLGASGYFIGTDEFALCFGTLVVNAVGNLYPIILQRYQRARVSKLDRFKPYEAR